MRTQLNGWIKRNERQDVDLAADVFRTDGSNFPARLLNISYEGCQLRCEVALEIGERIKVGLPGLGEIGAQVRWALPGKAGAYFVLEETEADEHRARMRV